MIKTVRIDCHLHTVRSGDSTLTLRQLAERIAAARLDVVCITDHHAIDGAEQAIHQQIGARVIVGEEIRTPVGEIIGLFLTQRVPYVLPLLDAARRIRDQGGLVYAPHPFDAGRTSLGEAGISALHRAGLLDVVEVFNAKIADQELNARAEAAAADLDLPAAAGSDAHDADGVGAASVELPDFDGPAEFLASLRQGAITGAYQPYARRF